MQSIISLRLIVSRGQGQKWIAECQGQRSKFPRSIKIIVNGSGEFGLLGKKCSLDRIEKGINPGTYQISWKVSEDSNLSEAIYFEDILSS